MDPLKAMRRVKNTWTALLAVMLLGAAGWRCLGQDEGTQNVALGKSFTCTSPGGIAWQGLLDGDRTSDRPPGCFATGPDAAYPKKIVIDLGAVYEIEQIIVYSSENGNTAKVEVWASRDGVSYERMRLPYTFPDKTAQSMSARFPPHEARYVKIALLDTYGGGLGGDNVLYLREVEVMGRAVAATAQTRARPTIDSEPPRSVRIFRHYALRPDADLRLLVIGDDSAVGPDGGLAAALADQLQRRYELGNVQVTAHSEAGYTAQRAAIYPVSLADESPDLVVVALGTADSLAFDPARFRAAMDELLAKLLERTTAMVVVVAPPAIPHSADLAGAEESATADTVDAAWQLVSLAQGRDVAIVDAAAVLEKSGLDVGTVYVDNLKLSSAGHEAVAVAIVDLFH
jgi:lysophospholipase L1-like esterase